jgi:hypothetical protein
MRESSTYRMILEEGREEGRGHEARRILLRQGRKRFGEPGPAIVANIEAMLDVAQIEEVLDRQGDVSSWEELLKED